MYIEERGTKNVPFGFIYSDDGKRRAVFTVRMDSNFLTLGGSGSGYFGHLREDELALAKHEIAHHYGRVVVD